MSSHHPPPSTNCSSVFAESHNVYFTSSVRYTIHILLFEHLNQCTAPTPVRNTTIFTSDTISFFDVVSLTDQLTALACEIRAPYHAGKSNNTAYDTQNVDNTKCFFVCVTNHPITLSHCLTQALACLRKRLTSNKEHPTHE